MDIEEEIATSYILIKRMGENREKRKLRKEWVRKTFPRIDKRIISICAFSLSLLVIRLSGYYTFLGFTYDFLRRFFLPSFLLRLINAFSTILQIEKSLSVQLIMSLIKNQVIVSVKN